jgi:GH24 family phage-related lysozyme (muramidase)
MQVCFLLPTSRRLTGDIYGLYNDGENNCTVGIGHLVHNGTCTSKDIALHKNTFPNGQTHSDAIQRLEEDATFVENDVNDNIKVHLTQQEFDALVDFTFNEGVNHLKISKLLKDINAGDCHASTISSDLLTFTRVGTLVDRRNDEANLFNDGVYG